MSIHLLSLSECSVYQAPILVFDDADPVSAANGAAFAAFVASGQTCVSGTRIIVQDGIYDDFMSLFLEKVRSITRRMGNRKLDLVSISPKQSLDLPEKLFSVEP